MMQTGVLFPPNVRALSEDTIANVVLRVESRHRTALSSSIVAIEQSDPPRFHAATEQCVDSMEAVEASNASTERYRQTADKLLEGKQTTPACDRDQQLSVEAVAALFAESKKLHRNRHRMNQQRYRLKQRKRTVELEEATSQLQEEIKRLSRRHDSLMSGISTKETVWPVAVEYFRVFRNGLLAPEGTHLEELNFLYSKMAPDVHVGSVCGLDALVKNWAIFTNALQDVQLELRRMEQISEGWLVASTITSITISEHSLQRLFPHLLGSDGRLAIARKLLGQRLVMHGLVRFGWDSDKDYVVSLTTELDMISPMMRLVGSAQDVNIVFNEALIAPDGNLVGERIKT